MQLNVIDHKIDNILTYFLHCRPYTIRIIPKALNEYFIHVYLAKWDQFCSTCRMYINSYSQKKSNNFQISVNHTHFADNA